MLVLVVSGAMKEPPPPPSVRGGRMIRGAHISPHYAVCMFLYRSRAG